MLQRGSSEPDLVLAYGPGPDEVADVRLGNEQQPLVVMLHGGFWRPEYDRRHLRPMTEAVAAAGFTVAAPEYRRIPGDPDATCEDVRVALRVLPVELRGRYDGRVVVAGHSAGGHLALWAASTAPAAGLHATLALAPVTDLVAAERDGLGDGAVAAFLGGFAAGRRDLDPIRCVSAQRPERPVHLLHGLADTWSRPASPGRTPRPARWRGWWRSTAPVTSTSWTRSRLPGRGCWTACGTPATGEERGS